MMFHSESRRPVTGEVRRRDRRSAPWRPEKWREVGVSNGGCSWFCTFGEGGVEVSRGLRYTGIVISNYSLEWAIK